jgi:hypothetical protein
VGRETGGVSGDGMLRRGIGSVMECDVDEEAIRRGGCEVGREGKEKARGA